MKRSGASIVEDAPPDWSRRPALLDVNVLIALAWPHHVHHDPAHRFFATLRGTGFATSALTETGFVRVSSNPVVIPGAKPPSAALALLAQVAALPGYRFVADDARLAAARFVDVSRLGGHRQVVDAHLVELALGHGLRFATFDVAVPTLLREGVPVAAVVVIAV